MCCFHLLLLQVIGTEATAKDNEAAMATYIAGFGRGDDAVSVSTAALGTEIDQAERLSRAPPCFGYQHLLKISGMKEFSAGLTDKLTRKGVWDYEEVCKNTCRAIHELQGSTKSALDALYGARASQMTEVNKRKHWVDTIGYVAWST